MSEEPRKFPRISELPLELQATIFSKVGREEREKVVEMFPEMDGLMNDTQRRDFSRKLFYRDFNRVYTNAWFKLENIRHSLSNYQSVLWDEIEKYYNAGWVIRLRGCIEKQTGVNVNIRFFLNILCAIGWRLSHCLKPYISSKEKKDIKKFVELGKAVNFPETSMFKISVTYIGDNIFLNFECGIIPVESWDQNKFESQENVKRIFGPYPEQPIE